MDTHATVTPERLWSTAQLAEYLGVPVKTIHQWRYVQKGPRGFRVGRHLRFRPADVRHLWPDSEDRTREAVDSVLGVAGAESVRNAGGRKK